MAQQSMSLTLFSVSLFVLSLNSGQIAAQKVMTWCIAKPSANDSLLQDNINYSCSHVDNKDCDAIRQGSGNPCYIPNTSISHATYAMNIYYQKNGRHQWNCGFQNSGLISLKDPSYGKCNIPGGETFVELGSTGKWCVARPSVNNESLRNNLEYACGHVDCKAISNVEGPCYNPNSLISQTSYAMNLYYQETGRPDSSCDFLGTGMIVLSDPSYGSCIYEYK